MLEYKQQIWKLYLKQIKEQKKLKVISINNIDIKLPVVTAIVLYHGKKKWDMKLRFADQMFQEEHKQFKAYIPDFEYILYDLSQYTDNEIKGTVLFRIAMLLLKHVFDPDFKKSLPNIFKLLGKLSNQQTGLQYIETVLRYIMSTRDDVSLSELKTLTKQAVLTDEKKEIVMTLAERLTGEGIEKGMEIGLEKGLEKGKQAGIREGIREGIQEGKQEGKREGIQKILATQFSHKLKLESQIVNNLFNDLSMEQMENIGTRIFEADNINDVKVWINDIKGLSNNNLRIRL